MNRRWCKLAQVVRGAKAWNFRFGSQEVEGEGYMRLKLDLEVWEASFSAPLGRVALLLCNFCRPMLCISAAYAVMRCLYVYVCLSVCPSRSWIVSKRINVSLKIFHHRVYSTRHSSSSIPNVMAIFRRNPPPPSLTGASSAGGVGMQKSRFWTNIWLQCVLWSVPAAGAVHLAATNHAEFITLVAGERPSLLMVENNDEVYDKPKTTLRSG